MKRSLKWRVRRSPHEQGVAAVLAMMFLVIFSSLAAAMAIVSQGNLQTADAHVKISRSLAAAETGLQFLIYRMNQGIGAITTDQGVIDEMVVEEENLWRQARDALMNSLAGDQQYQDLTFVVDDDTGGLSIPSIAVGPGEAVFSATFVPHPLPDEDYDSAYYDRKPYSNMNPPVSNVNPLDGTLIRVTITAVDGPLGAQVTRSIAMDFQISKKIPFAMLSRSRVMLGRNVVIEGPIGSRFMEVDLPNGHPVQMESDFRGLHEDLDANLDLLVGSLIGDETYHDTNGDNRIDVHNPIEVGDLDPDMFDVNSDGYIDEYDFFLDHFDSSEDGEISKTELENGLGYSNGPIYANQLMELIDTFGNPHRAGYGDGVIDALDRYTKIRGEIYVSADMADWNAGAAGGAYQDYFQGLIDPGFKKNPLTFNSYENDIYQFGPQDFDVSMYSERATGDLAAQASEQMAVNPNLEPDLPIYDGAGVIESVPFGAAHPYDYYDRPVYKNMVFTDVRIPRGANALFENCQFNGVVFIESEVDNTDPNYNYAGMQEADGSDRYPDRSAEIDGVEYASTKDISNNIRFHNCIFDGGIVTVAPNEFTHTRNKISFTGVTQFKDMRKSVVEDSENGSSLTNEERSMYSRSSILAPHYSVEMGTFVSPDSSGEKIQLQGTIVAGILDMRGQVKVDGTILTTFEPVSDTGPVLGETSPQFNTTLGYFSSAQGDLEAELPPNGLGVIQVMYDDDRPLPDGITGPITIEPNMATYFEVHY